MTAIFIIATGTPNYLQMALNLCLSVKENSSLPVVLLHDIRGDLPVNMKSRLDRYFDNSILLPPCDNPIQQAHEAKLNFYDLIKCCGYKAGLLLDADTIVFPKNDFGKLVDDLRGAKFTAYTASYHNLKTGREFKEDAYKYWCNPKDVRKYYGARGILPQINASFLYVELCEETKRLFEAAWRLWVEDIRIPHDTYNGIKTEEMCLNIACAITRVVPHKMPFMPIYFQYQHEEVSYPYATQYWSMMSMAGQLQHHRDLIDHYNQLGSYYRRLNGINDNFEYTPDSKRPEEKQLVLEPLYRKTLVRRGETPNSDGGIFNPSHYDGITLYRKERNMDAYKREYTHGTAICAVGFGGVLHDAELIGFSKEGRLEDFRIIGEYDNHYLVSHSIVQNRTHDKIYANTSLSLLGTNGGFYLRKLLTPKLPIKTGDSEKNWTFFIEDGYLYCIYSLSPYKLFRAVLGKWVFERVQVESKKLDWWDYTKFICNSTNPVLIGAHYVIMFHTKHGGKYSHGAVLINKATKRIDFYTKCSINVKEWGEGLHKDLIYVSGLSYDGTHIDVFFGESDSHACYARYDAQTFINAIKRPTCTQKKSIG